MFQKGVTTVMGELRVHCSLKIARVRREALQQQCQILKMILIQQASYLYRGRDKILGCSHYIKHETDM